MNKIITLVLSFLFSCWYNNANPLIMINPAGHATDVGRKLHEGYERAETLKCAEKLQQELWNRYKLRTLLTRSPGEEILPLQAASFANRLTVDLFINLHFYREKSVKPKIYLYQLVFNPLLDFASRHINPLDFIPLHQAHFKNIHTTKSIALRMRSLLTQEKYQKQSDVYGPFGIPLKPLIGIVAPALALEIGIHEDNQWLSLIEPLVESLGKIIELKEPLLDYVQP